MKDKLSSLDYKFLLSELSLLVNARLDKISKQDSTWLLEFYVTSKGKKLLKISLGKYFCFTKQKIEATGSNFSQYLRKYLTNARLKSISQIDSERIIKLELAKETYYLIFEMFGKGNVILCDKDSIILKALENQSFKDRQIIQGIKYIYPKSSYNLFSEDFNQFNKIVKESSRDSIVKTLAIEIGLSGIYAEELCLLSGLDKTKKALSGQEIKRLFENLSNLLDSKIKAFIIYSKDNQEAIDVVPIDLKLYQDYPKKEFPSFNEAIDTYYQTVSKKSSKYEKEINKLRKIIEQEQAKILELEEQEMLERSRAEAIYNNYQLIQEILTELKKARQKYSWKEIKEKLKGHKIIKDVNEKEGKVEIDL